jgi:hypothetical protein
MRKIYFETKTRQRRRKKKQFSLLFIAPPAKFMQPYFKNTRRKCNLKSVAHFTFTDTFSFFLPLEDVDDASDFLATLSADEEADVADTNLGLLLLELLRDLSKVARFFSVQQSKTGKIYQITTKCTKWL